MRGYGAVFHVGKNDILLRLVEAVNFVYEEDGRLTLHAAAITGFSDNAPQVGNSGGYGADLLEGGLGGAGHESGEGGLAGTGRPPEDERGEASRGDGAEEDPVWADHVLLTDVFIEGAGTHAICQWGSARSVDAALALEQ